MVHNERVPDIGQANFVSIWFSEHCDFRSCSYRKKERLMNAAQRSLISPFALFAVLLAVMASHLASSAERRDMFVHLIEANKAQLVMLSEEKLIDTELARQISLALSDYEQAQSSPAAVRSSDYLVLEDALIQRVGVAASNLHIGRSRNDLGAAMNRMALRESLLDALASLNGARSLVLGLVRDHLHTLAPGFTHAVQAQPTTLAHLLLAFDDALQRDFSRLQEVYVRTNKSPLGAAAITTSGFAINRERLAELLAFDGLVENSYDAIAVSTVDSKLEIAAALSISAIGVGRLAQDLLFQYDDPAPAIVLSESMSGRSSIMPQKRNPSSIESLRVLASEVTADAHKATLYAHNTPLHEVRDVRNHLFLVVHDLLLDAQGLYRQLGTVLEALEFREAALRERIDQDYSTMTEVADALHRASGVPFRQAHEFASALTSLGRAGASRPSEIRYSAAAELYASMFEGAMLPLDEETLAAAIDAGKMVSGRKGTGGPQPAETRRMLDQSQRHQLASGEWIQARRQAIATRSVELNSRFVALFQ